MCPFSNCVGRRNYRWFVSFVLSVNAYCLYVFACSLFYLIHDQRDEDKTFVDSLSRNPVATVEVCFTFFLGCCLCSMASYHCALIAQGQTTNQNIKSHRSRNYSRDGPETLIGEQRGCVDSFRHFACDPVPPSQIDLRAPAPLWLVNQARAMDSIV